ncbi:MAG: DUF58 domain-containing protein [Planctomycetota bacterium]|jgi:uncharacterized protein (DUF58 family)
MPTEATFEEPDVRDAAAPESASTHDESNSPASVSEVDSAVSRSSGQVASVGSLKGHSVVTDASTAKARLNESGKAATQAEKSHWLIRSVVGILNYDFCPWANRFVYWMRHPLGFMAVTGILAICCAVFLNVYAWMAVAGVCVVLLLGTVWPWVALRGLEARLSWESPRVREGDVVRVRLTLRNRCPWPVWGITLRGGFRQEGTSTALARVAGMADVSFAWEFTPVERGVYPTEPPTMETGFPFGIWSASTPVTVDQELLVWPRIVRLNGLPDLTESQPSEEHLTDRRAGDLGDLLGTRHFRQGDSLRRIHWSQSARHQRLIVTERQAGVEARVRVRVDATAAHHAGSGPDSSLNWTLRFAASICEILSSEHAHVDCVVGNEVVCLSHPGGMRRLMDRLACVPEGGFDEAAVKAVSSKADGCEIHCTTDLAHDCHHRGGSTPRGHRDVVLAASAFESGEGSSRDSDSPARGTTTKGTEHHCEAETSHRRPWLLVDAVDDIAAVFQRQWQHSCRVA